MTFNLNLNAGNLYLLLHINSSKDTLFDNAYLSLLANTFYYLIFWMKMNGETKLSIRYFLLITLNIMIRIILSNISKHFKKLHNSRW